MKKPPTKREVAAAIRTLAAEPSVFAQITFLLEKVSPGFMLAVLSPKGNGMTVTRRTNRFLRGMVRKALREETAKPE